MGIFDEIKDAVDTHEAQIEAGVDRGADAIDEITGGRFAEQVDQAQEFLKDHIGAEDAPADAPEVPVEPGVEEQA